MTDAIPAPSALTARSIVWPASLSPCSSARAQMPLVRRVRSCSSISLNRSVLRALLLVQLAHVGFHRGPSRIRLHAAAPPARAARAVDLDDHVPDLAGAAAPGPRLAVEDQAAAHARAPEHPEQRAVQPSRAELELGVGRDLHVVADRDTAAERRVRASSASGNVPSQPGRLRALVTLPSSIVPGEPTPTPASDAGLELRRLGRVAQRRLHLRGDISRAALGRRRAPSRAEHVVLVVDDHRLDLGPAEIDSAVAGHRARIIAERAAGAWGTGTGARSFARHQHKKDGRKLYANLMRACRLSSPPLTAPADYRGERR